MVDTESYYPRNNPECHYERSMCSVDSKELFKFLFFKYDINTFCEIGSYTGGGIEHLLSVKSDLFICAIDSWDNEIMINILKNDKQNKTDPQGIKKLINDLKEYSLYDAFITNIWHHKDQILPLKMDSVEGIYKINDLNIKPDVFFVDSSHQYENTKNELNTINKLFPESIICGDDYRVDVYDGVVRAVNEFVKENNYLLKTFGASFLIVKHNPFKANYIRNWLLSISRMIRLKASRSVSFLKRYLKGKS